MEKYLGVKIIEAEPQSKYEQAGFKAGTFNPMCGPDGGIDQGGYKTLRMDKTYGWIPKEIFEKDYKVLIPGTEDIIKVDYATGGWWYYLESKQFTRDDLAKFGEYLFSEERLNSLRGLTQTNVVYHSDVENFIEKLKTN